MAAGGQHGGLIGRAPELEVAARLLRDSAAGQPRLLLLTGPAGVGKSTLARAATAQAARHGARVLWGAGQEELAIPYLPIAMAFEGLREDGEPAPLVLDDDPATSWARAADRLVLATERQPLVLVLDDLQWADPASQAMFLHLLVVLEHVAQTRPVRCCTIVTVRTPVDDERTQRTMSRLRREPGTQVLDLAGLDRAGVAQLVSAVCPSRPTALVVERVAEATDGNPLLVESLVRRGLAEQRLVERDGALGLRDAADHLAVDPSELDHGVVARLEALEAPVQRLLTVAALLGDEQPVDELLDVAGPWEGDADEVLDAAVAAGLLVERGSRCAFAHPQVRRAVFHRPAQRRRQRLHAEIADALERRHGEAGALRIAHHLVRAVDRVEPARVARWCALAARHAWGQGAWADASIAGEHALEALPAEAPWEERADLHLLVADAATRDFDLATVVRHGRQAIALAAEHGDAARWGRAVLPMARSLTTSSGEAGAAPDPTALLHDFLRANPHADPDLRAEVLSLQSEILGVANRPDDALDAAVAARALLTPGSAPEIVGLVHVAEGMARWSQLDLRAACAAYDAATAATGVRPPSRPGVYAGVRVNLVRHLLGDLDAALRDGPEMVGLLEAAQVWGEHAVAAAGVATSALVRGDFDDVERYGGMVERSARRTAYVQPMPIAMAAVALGRALRGDGRGAGEAIGLGFGGSGLGARHRLAVDALLGDVDRVRAAVAERPWRAPRPEASLASLPGVVLQAEVAVAVGDAEMAASAMVPLRDAHQRGVVLSHGWAVLLSRLVAECAAATGDRVAAEEWLRVAADEAGPAGAAVEQARVELARARLLAGDPDVDPERAAAQAATAVVALDRVGALPLVAVARRLGLVGDAPGPATRTILFTDLVDSTGLNVRVGDAAFLQLVREHNEVVRACLRRSAGVEFKHTGDGVAAWFTSAVDAVECAMAINADLDRATELHPEAPLLVRCGLSSGEPLGNEGDLFGLTVVEAARLCAAAGPGEVYVAPRVVEAARAHGIVFRSLGPRQLRGFPEPVEVSVAVMTDERASRR